MKAIHQLAFTDEKYLYLIRKMGEGKSAVLLTAAYFQRDIVRSDQLSKSMSPSNCIESYPLDEHKYDDMAKLWDHLVGMNMNEVENHTILLFASSQSLTPQSKWFHAINSLFKKGFISMICIDEAHCIETCGRSFRPEFVNAVNTILRYLKEDPTIPFLAMLATFQKKTTKILYQGN